MQREREREREGKCKWKEQSKGEEEEEKERPETRSIPSQWDKCGCRALNYNVTAFLLGEECLDHNEISRDKPNPRDVRRDTNYSSPIRNRFSQRWRRDENERRRSNVEWYIRCLVIRVTRSEWFMTRNKNKGIKIIFEKYAFESRNQNI